MQKIFFWNKMGCRGRRHAFGTAAQGVECLNVQNEEAEWNPLFERQKGKLPRHFAASEDDAKPVRLDPIFANGESYIEPSSNAESLSWSQSNLFPTRSDAND